jgi:hypothetical protein
VRIRRRLAAVLGAGVLLLAGVALASCGSDEASDTTTEPTTTTTTTTTTTETTTPPEGPTVVRVRVVNGAPRGGIVRRTVDQGDRVAIVVTSDVADHIHLHGYDIVRDVAAGGTARIAFRATVPGRFEVELEDRMIQIADITVQP